VGAILLNHDLVKEIFEKAIDLPVDPPEVRERFIQEQSEGNKDIIAEVQSLLSCTSEEDDFDYAVDPVIGLFAGPWKILHRIGGGGMGRVYEAINPRTNHQAAIKVLKRIHVDRTASKRFEQEVRVLGRLDHRGIARIKGAGTLELDGDRIPWVAMELIDGATPISTFATNKTTKEKLKLLLEVCHAVGESHKRGVIHRDLKPSNILINSSNEVKIIDFGIAKVIDDTIHPTGLHTKTGGFLGTIQYMPPESCCDSSDAQTTFDVYSLGVIMYELLSNHRPYSLRGDSFPALIQAMATTDPTPIEQEFPVYKGPIAAVVHKALARNPQNRYSTANEFAVDLNHLLDGTPVNAQHESRLVKFIRNHRTATVVLVITIPILIIATGVSTYFAISAKRQLVRNEKLLEFAEEAMQTQHYIISQQSKYWAMHLGIAKDKADKLSENDLALRLEMYKLLSKSDLSTDVSSEYAAEIYKEAMSISKNKFGINAPETILLEAKITVGRTDGAKKELTQQLQSLKERWVGGSFEQEYEFLRLIAFGQLASSDKNTRELGHHNSERAIEIATHHLGADEITNVVNRQVWSYVFFEGDLESLNKAVSFQVATTLPLLEEEYPEKSLQVLKAKILLGLAFYSRSTLQSGNDRLQDLEKAIELNEFAVDALIEQSGDGYNYVWQVMNNLAICLAEKADWLDEYEGANQKSSELRIRAASIWQRILQQVHFKEAEGNHHNGWYLRTFQDYLPNLAPSEEDWYSWLETVNQLPVKSD